MCLPLLRCSCTADSAQLSPTPCPARPALCTQHLTPLPPPRAAAAADNGKVYDVTQYMAQGRHPGGNRVIVPYCGADATDAFDRAHRSPQAAQDQEQCCYIGPLLA